jgi:hypothetical protein
MTTIRLKPGESALVVAQRSDVAPDHGLPTPQPPTAPVDPGYGIDLGLGWLRPTHPIVLPPPVEPPTAPVDPVYGIDEDIGYVKPEHPIVLPPKPELKWELKTAWTPETGWVVVAVPTGEHVTPSKRK